MTLHIPLKMPNFQAVAAGQTANLNLPVGWTYRTLILKYQTAGVNATEAQMKADLSAVRLKINGTVVNTYTATELIDIHRKYMGLPVIDGMLFIPLARQWVETIQMQDALAWGTSNVRTFSVEADIAAGALTPSLSCHALQDPEPNDLGLIITSHRYSYNATGAGTFEISDFPKGYGAMFGMHISSAVVTGYTIKVNNQEISDTELDVANAFLQDAPAKRVPQAGYVHIDPIILQRVADVVNMNAQDWRLKLTTSGAGAIDVLVETMDSPLGIVTAKK